MDDKALRAALEQVLERRDLSEVQAAAVLTALTSEVPPALAGGILAALRADRATSWAPVAMHRAA